MALSKIFFEKTTFAKCQEIYIMVVLQKNFKVFNFENFQNSSNPPYWILKTQKNAIFSGSVQNYCCYKGQIGKIQLSTILFSENRAGGLVTDKHWAYFDSSCLL